MSGLFQVYFDGINWVGLILEESDHRCRVGRYIFGNEPTPLEIFEWARKGCPGLRLSELPAGSPLLEELARGGRLTKETRRAQENKGLGTFAQEQLRQSIEANKKAARIKFSVLRKRRAEERFLNRQAKKRKRKRGH